DKCAGILQHFLRVFDLAQELRDFGLDAAITADVDLPPGIYADDAHVLDARFGAVTRAAGAGEFDLMRAVPVREGLFDIDTQLRRILRAEAAELRADAGLNRA